MNDFWPDFKEMLIDTIKFLILVVVMTIGFWTLYKMAWTAVGLPEPGWYSWALLGLAGYTEYCYCCLLYDY
jgi:hypothetical protein